LKTPEVSVIVVNYNGGEPVKTCLESVFRQQAPFDYEVIVVDNASSDGSRENISARFPGVRLIANEENLGFSRANNQAIRQSLSPYILLLNNDAYLTEENFLERAVAFMERRKDSAAVGPEIISPAGRVQNPYYISFPNLATEFLSLSGLLSLYNSFNKDGYFYTREGLAHYKKGPGGIIVSHLCGACMFLRRKAVEETGLLDERMFFYREDMDICFRFRRNKWKILVAPFVTAIHIGTESSKKAPFSVTGEAVKSMYIFFKKNYGKRKYVCLRALHFFTAFFRLLIYPLLRATGKSSSGALALYTKIFKYSLTGIR
jgi:GT2 family glycosyltransferase